MHPAGFESEIPASERSQTYALEHAATGIDFRNITIFKFTGHLFAHFLQSNISQMTRDMLSGHKCALI
jgi:hypothetical protein